MLTALHTIIGELRPRRRASRVLYTFGAFWFLAGVLHVLMLAATGFEWSGSVSWRKPIVFGVSIGLLLPTVGWILDRLPDRRWIAGSIAWMFAVSSTIEVGLVTLQTWRGEASHFNTMEPANAAIFGIMGTMVGVMSLCLVAVFVWAVRSRPTDRLVSTAVTAGMTLVTFGLGIGSWLVQLGNEFVSRYAAVPETVLNGAAGEPKFPHAIAFHGIQVFIVAAIALRHSSVDERSRRRSMRVLVVAYSALLGFASIQAVVGAAPAAATIWTAGQAGAVFVLVATAFRIGSGVARRPVPQQSRRPLAVG